MMLNLSISLEKICALIYIGYVSDAELFKLILFLGKRQDLPPICLLVKFPYH